MSKTSEYLIAYATLLIAGLVLLRVFIRGEYLRRGRLSLLGSALQSLLFFFYGGFPILYLRQDWPAVQVGGIQAGLGYALVGLGLACLFYGMFQLGVGRSVGRGQPNLRTTGLYRYTRNPQALACGLYVIGFALLWPSAYALGWVILYMVLIHAMVITEEEHLLHTYQDQYLAYRRRVPRYIGWTARIS